MLKRGLLFSLAALVLGVVGFGVVRHRSTRMVTPYDRATRPLAEVATEGRRLGLEPVEVGSLRALMRRPVSGHAWLLYWGGNTSTYFQEAVDTLVGLALPPELGILVVAPPGYDSEGRATPEELEADAVRARQWLRQHEGASQIVTGGFSMGIYPALVAAEQDVVATFIMGNATVFEAGEPGRLIRFRVSDKYRIRPSPPKVPALVIQGELDELQMGRDIATWLGARLVVLPGVGHVATQRDPVALREARAFILSSLSLRERGEGRGEGPTE